MKTTTTQASDEYSVWKQEFFKWNSNESYVLLQNFVLSQHLQWT